MGRCCYRFYHHHFHRIYLFHLFLHRIYLCLFLHRFRLCPIASCPKLVTLEKLLGWLP